MCFRPAEADAGVHPVKCANCGKRVFPTEGLLPKKCPFCKEELVEAADSAAPALGAPGVPTPGAPGVPAPGAPKPPVAPAPPAAPGAPKPPVA